MSDLSQTGTVMPAGCLAAGRGPPQTPNQLDWVPGKEHKPLLQGEATAWAEYAAFVGLHNIMCMCCMIAACTAKTLLLMRPVHVVNHQLERPLHAACRYCSGWAHSSRL